MLRVTKAQAFRRPGKPLVAGPKTRTTSQHGRGKQMDIHPADTLARKTMPVDKGQRFDVGRDRRARQQAQRVENTGALLQLAARKLADDEWMAKYQTLLEQVREPHIATPEMIDPD
jgi:hypothetical protein